MAVDNISAFGTSENVANQILLTEDEVETAAFMTEFFGWGKVPAETKLLAKITLFCGSAGVSPSRINLVA